MPFAENLKYMMDFFDLTNYRLAKELGCSQTTISNYLDKTTMPRKKAQENIAGLFGITVEELMGNSLPHIKGENRLRGKKNAAPISEDGKSEILSIFDSLSPDRRSKLLELARLYLDDQRKNEETE